MKVLEDTHVVDGTLSTNDDPVIHRSVINSRTLVCEQLYILFHSNHSQTSSFPSLPLSVVLINLDEALMYLIVSMPSARWPSIPRCCCTASIAVAPLPRAANESALFYNYWFQTDEAVPAKARPLDHSTMLPGDHS